MIQLAEEEGVINPNYRKPFSKRFINEAHGILGRMPSIGEQCQQLADAVIVSVLRTLIWMKRQKRSVLVAAVRLWMRKSHVRPAAHAVSVMRMTMMTMRMRSLVAVDPSQTSLRVSVPVGMVQSRP
jgi:hypothetical protein